MGRVDGKIAMVTGAAAGLGAATAQLLAAEGALVAVTDVDVHGAERVAAAINAEFGEAAIPIAHDVTDPARWEHALRTTEEAFGGLNLLVNNAGIALRGSTVESTLADWRRVVQIDLDGVFLGCKLAMPYLEKSGGAIVNMSSVAALIGGAQMAAYAAAKAGVCGLTRSVALDCCRRRVPVRCNAVLPAWIDTAILDPIGDAQSRERLLAGLARAVPMGRVGRPVDVAYAVLYLCSDEAAYVTGIELVIDGGVTIREP